MMNQFIENNMNSLYKILNQLAVCLMDKNWQLVTAESCTGGMVSAFVTELPGSSRWFDRGFVTYSNDAKEVMLGVSSELIMKYGAVSKEVASAMALGALNHSKGDIALAITGIAGPGGGDKEKPVGLVCFSWAIRDGSSLTTSKNFSGIRQEIRLAACTEALQGALSLLQNS